MVNGNASSGSTILSTQTTASLGLIKATFTCYRSRALHFGDRSRPVMYRFLLVLSPDGVIPFSIPTPPPTLKSLWSGFVGLRSGLWATSGMRYHLGGMQISENYVILRNAWDQTSQVLNHENKIV